MTITFTNQVAANGALPTPPHSPQSQHPQFAFAFANQYPQQGQGQLQVTKHTSTVLGSLTSFYQQEQYWVHHTRAALELAVTKGIDGPAQPLATATEGASSPETFTINIKTEPESDSDCSAPASPSSTSTSLSEPSSPTAEQRQISRWLRRKNRMQLRLSGISPHDPKRKRRPARAPQTEPAARLLEMFAELVDARMESCARMERLVRESSLRKCAVC